MNRRHYLTTIVGVASVSVSGCASVAGEVTLTSPDEETRAGNVQFVHDYDNTDVLTVSLMQLVTDSVNRRLDIELQHPQDVDLESLQFRFKPESQYADHQPGGFLVYLLPPSDKAAALDFYEQGQWTVVETPSSNSAEQLNKEFNVLLFVRGGAEELVPLRLSYEVVLSESGYLGGTYVAQHETTIDLDELLQD